MRGYNKKILYDDYVVFFISSNSSDEIYVSKIKSIKSTNTHGEFKLIKEMVISG